MTRAKGRRPKKNVKHCEYPCTNCGGDATIALSNWSGPEGILIGKDERLCLRCAKARKVRFL